MESLVSLEALRCFVEAARLLNFRAAARAVSLTPAALGQRIRQLETQLDTTLFVRTTRSVVLTEAGLSLVPHALKAIAAVAECGRVARGEKGPAPLDLVLGTRHELGISWIVPMLPHLEKRFPHLTVHLYFGSGEDLMLRVRTVEIDCAVTSTRLTDPKLDSQKLHLETYVFVGAPALVKARPMRKPEHARDHTLIDVGPSLPLFRYWRDAPGGVDSLEFAGMLGMGTIAAIRAAVLRGHGVAVLPEYYVRPDLEARRLVRLMPEVELLSDHFRLVHRADDPRRVFYQELARALLEMPLK